MGQSLKLLNFLYSGHELHIMIKNHIYFIKFGPEVMRIQLIENCVYPVLFLERQELRPIINMQKFNCFHLPLQAKLASSA